MIDTNSSIQVVVDVEEMAHKACDLITKAAIAGIKEKGFFTLVLSGGETPALTYKKLATRPLPWGQIHLFWGDERPVGPESLYSNFGMVQKELISKISIPAENIHRILGESPDSEFAAELYTKEIQAFFQKRGLSKPQFDFILLGMGEDGHTASLFPGTPFKEESDKWVEAFWVKKLKSYRISMLPSLLNQGSFILVLVGGEGKIRILKKMLDNPDSKEFPIAEIRPEKGRLEWLVLEEG